jgi:site-specific recombinase XerC
MFLTYLQDTSIITPPPSVKLTIQDPVLLLAFCQWMRQQRGTCDVTLYTYSIYIRELLRQLGEQPSRFDARQLRAFILEKSRSCGRPTAKNCAKVLRVFLRFLIAKGQCAVGLDDAIPTLAHWRLASLPRYLAPEDVERLIASCDRASSVDRRDRAILLLLARLGLRAGDIVHLRLSDIDWKNASIQVCGKGRRHARLPLTQEVGTSPPSCATAPWRPRKWQRLCYGKAHRSRTVSWEGVTWRRLLAKAKSSRSMASSTSPVASG